MAVQHAGLFAAGLVDGVTAEFASQGYIAM
jgi:hypothetical protein